MEKLKKPLGFMALILMSLLSALCLKQLLINDVGRFQMIREKSGWITRLDTQTGEVSTFKNR
jgi:hypothetical protein